MPTFPKWLYIPLLLSVLLWLPTLSAPFQFDDYNVIVDYAPVHSLSAWWQSMPGIRPLLKLSYTLNWLLSPSATSFHVTNLLIHIINSLLLYGWLKRLSAFTPVLALWISLLWFVHPATTEAVTYIAGRSVSLSTTFLLAALYLLHGDHHAKRYWLAGLTVAAMLVRETAWIFPALLTLSAWLNGENPRRIWRTLRPTLIVLLAGVAVLLAITPYPHLLEVSFASRSPTQQILGQINAYSYLLTQPTLLLTPNIDPDIAIPEHMDGLVFAKGLILLVLAVGSLWQALRYRCWLSGGIVWLFLGLLPTNSLIPRLDLANDRHLYPALIGLSWTLVLIAKNLRWYQPVLLGLWLVLSVATLVRNEDYRSEIALWSRTSDQSPNKSRGWNNLGVACQKAGDMQCADMAFSRALQLDKNDLKAGNNLYFLRHNGK